MTPEHFTTLLTRRVSHLKAGSGCPSLCTTRTTGLVLQALGEFLGDGPGEYQERKDLIAMLCMGRPHESYSQGNWWNDMPVGPSGDPVADLAAITAEINTCP